jgi:hypothetical protein
VLLKSVQEATTAVDEMRLVSERAMYLGTRLPLLTGGFVYYWISELFNNPGIERILKSMDKVSDSSVNFTNEIKQIPDLFGKEREKTINQAVAMVEDLRERTFDKIMDRVSTERQDAIEQLMEGLAEERKGLLHDLTSEDQGVTDLLSNLRLTLAEGKEMTSGLEAAAKSVDTLVARFIPQTPDSTTGDPKSFHILDYKETVVEISNTVNQLDHVIKSLNELLTSSGWEKTLPHILEAVKMAEDEGEDLVKMTFNRFFLLIPMTMFAMVLGLLIYRFIAHRLFDSPVKGK